MQLFSKRYPPSYFRRTFPLEAEGEKLFITQSLRNRLKHEIKFIVTSTERYIEPFLISIDKKDSSIHLHGDSLKDLTVSELGYDLTDILNCYQVELATDEYTDFYLFDLMEILFIFATEQKRTDLIKRFQDILIDERCDFIINNFMVVYKRETGLRAITPLIKDRVLKAKLEDYYAGPRLRSTNYEVSARITADILQYLFSSKRQKSDTKKQTEALCKKVALKWTTKGNSNDLAKLISDTVLVAKSLNNQISNVRHTDKFTIPVDNLSFYKMVTNLNFSIIELVIQSFPEDYIISKSATDLKSEYMLRYKLINQKEHIIDSTPSADDIPF